MAQDQRAALIFDAVSEAIDGIAAPAGFQLGKVPAPKRLAPYAYAMTAEVEGADPDDLIADGRLVLLHDPAGQPAWNGAWRFVLFARASLEQEMAADPLLTDVGWTWLQESLGEHDLALVAFGGTVTRTTSQSYAAMADRPTEGQLEIRTSWTAALDRTLGERYVPEVLRLHAVAWLELLGTMAGLEPADQDGIPRIGHR